MPIGIGIILLQSLERVFFYGYSFPFLYCLLWEKAFLPELESGAAATKEARVKEITMNAFILASWCEMGPSLKKIEPFMDMLWQPKSLDISPALSILVWHNTLAVLYSYSTQMTIMYFNILTIFGNFFANCVVIFQKTEVQTVILRCLTGLNLEF